MNLFGSIEKNATLRITGGVENKQHTKNKKNFTTTNYNLVMERNGADLVAVYVIGNAILLSSIYVTL